MSVWSNIAYVIAGLLLWDNPVICISMIALGASSAMAHWKGGFWWRMDWATMYLSFGAICLHNFGIPPLLSVNLGALGGTFGYDNYYLFGTLFAVTILSAYLIGISVIIPLALFALALAFQRYAESHMGTKTYEIYHSLWHVLTATSMYLLV